MPSDDSLSSPENVSLVPDLQGIIEIFGRSLYNEFGAIVRELVQNAHDAIVQAECERGAERLCFDNYWIRVDYDEYKRTLVVHDNGKGMNRKELIASLNYFGKKKKQAARADVASQSADFSVQIIGLYGVGFLAAMAVSERVEVWSLSDDGTPVLWEYDTGNSTARASDVGIEDFTRMRQIYGMGTVPAKNSGTLVICRLAQSVEEEYGVHSETIRNSLLRYARILPIALFFKREQISGQLRAWNQPGLASLDDWRAMIEDVTGEKPLLVIPIFSPANELDLQGVLWIPERKSYLGEECYIDIYIRRMFVAQDDRVIRPVWAAFVKGMLNSNRMGRIVAGNSFIEDKHVTEVATFLKTRIMDEFRRLRNLPDEQYWAVIGAHDDIIKKSAVDNAEFLDCVWDKLRVRSRARSMTLPDYLAEVERRSKSKNTIYYFDQPTQEFAAGVISDATGVPVLSLVGLSDGAFVKEVSRRKKFELHPSTDLAGDVIKQPENVERYQPLIIACRQSKIAAEIREYEPSHMPAMLVEDGSLQERREEILSVLRSSSDHNTSRVAAQLEQTFVRESSLNRDVAFYLNSSNELIKQLLDATPETQQAICLALYNISYMSIMPQLRKAEVAAIYSSLCSVLQNLLGQTQERKERRRANPSGCPTRIFMIAPYADEYRTVEKAVREVFEGPPYFFEVVLARDFMIEAQLFDDLVAHMGAADAFIAEISDLNPNVMLELGAVIFDSDRNRPIVALRHRDAKPVPADLKAQLTISYGSPGDSPEDISKAIRKLLEVHGQVSHREIAALLQRRTCRSLSAGLLSRTRCMLNETERKAILSQFKSLDQLLEVSTAEAARRTGVSETVLEFLQKQLRDFLCDNGATKSTSIHSNHE